MLTSRSIRFAPTQINNRVFTGEPFTCGALTPANKRKESMRPEAAADNQPANSVSDVEKSIHTFDGRHFFQENSRVESTVNHAFPPSFEYTEQLRIEALSPTESNHDFINLFGFRRAGSIQRPTVSGDRDFANDNEPLREAEAA